MIKDLDDIDELDRGTLSQLWREAFGSPPPRKLSQPIMQKVLASEIQWKASGQSRAAIIRRLKRVQSTADRAGPTAQPGNRIVREWNGKRHTVDVTRDGYVWNGKTWRSLSAIAQAITGAKWSGPRFFGVRR